MDRDTKNDITLVAKDFFAVACSSLIYQASFIFLLWYSMHRLPVAQVGLFGLAVSASMFITTIISWGLRQVYALEYYHAHSEQRRELVTDLISIFLMLSVGWGLIFMLILSRIPVLYILAVMIAIATFFTELLYQTFVYQGHAAHMALVKSCSACGTLAGALYLLSAYPRVECIFIAQLFSLCGVLAYGFWLYAQRVGFGYIDGARSVDRMKQYLIQGSPFVPGVLAGWLLASGNRWVLSAHGSLDTVAVYTIAEYITPIFNLVLLTPLAGTYHPRVLQKMAQRPDNILMYEQANKKVMVLACLALIGAMHVAFYLGRPLAVYLLPGAYSDALDGMYYIAWGNIFLFATYFLTILLFYFKKSLYLMASILAAALCNSGLAYVLIPHYGINGCYIACIASYALYFTVLLGMNSYLVRQVHKDANIGTVKHAQAPYYSQ